MLNAAIIGGSGYTGLELLRLLAQHPEVEVSFITSRQYKGLKVQDVFPALNGLYDIVFSDLSDVTSIPDVDVVFTALPHTKSMEIVPKLLEAGMKVIDLSADFRLKEAKTYEAYYGPHSATHLLREAVYGIPEIHRGEIKKARLVANPGCYAIASILGLAPLASKGLIGGGVIIDAKSGVSGAGRIPSIETAFVEINENLRPYKVAEHRHTPEIEQELNLLEGSKEVKVTLVPHLLPLSRGILATIYIPSIDLSEKELFEIFKGFYRGEGFVRILPSDCLPNLSYVRGSNFCDISVKIDGRCNRAIVIVAIDNLVKGASGNAIQNMNLLFGLSEKVGLLPPLYP